MIGPAWRIPAVVAACAASCALGWWLSPQPEPGASLVQPRRDAWSLPELPFRPDSNSLLVRVSEASYWGAPPPPAPIIPGEDRRWRVSAIFGVDSKLKLRIDFRNSRLPAIFREVGDNLPSGHRIVKIMPTEYCVEVGDGVYRFGIERSEN
jgi:hypothetical protein